MDKEKEIKAYLDGELLPEVRMKYEIAEEMGLTKPGEAEHIRKVLDIYGLPHKCDLMLHDLIGAIALDKKNLGGKLNIVLLKEIGKSYTYPTTTEFFTEHDRMV